MHRSVHVSLLNELSELSETGQNTIMEARENQDELTAERERIEEQYRG